MIQLTTPDFSKVEKIRVEQLGTGLIAEIDPNEVAPITVQNAVEAEDQPNR